jgi:hypothetical protein
LFGKQENNVESALAQCTLRAYSDAKAADPIKDIEDLAGDLAAAEEWRKAVGTLHSWFGLTGWLVQILSF